MGNTKSSGKETQGRSPETQPSEDFKRVLLLHKSADNDVKQTVKHFRLALEQGASGGVDVKDHNVETKGPIKDFSWLEDWNNVVVICLSPEILKSLAAVVRDKRFADENGHLHANIISVSFGKGDSTTWPPDGCARPHGDEKDFCFDFEDKVISPSKFEGAKLNSIIATIIGMK